MKPEFSLLYKNQGVSPVHFNNNRNEVKIILMKQMFKVQTTNFCTFILPKASKVAINVHSSNLII